MWNERQHSWTAVNYFPNGLLKSRNFSVMREKGYVSILVPQNTETKNYWGKKKKAKKSAIALLFKPVEKGSGFGTI